MPLLDHFHAPLFPQRSWEAFHGKWANCIGDYLNSLLPRRYFAEALLRLGTDVAADVAEFNRPDEPDEALTNGPVGGGGVALQTWIPPAVSLALPLTFPDEIEVQVLDER